MIFWTGAKMLWLAPTYARVGPVLQYLHYQSLLLWGDLKNVKTHDDRIVASSDRLVLHDKNSFCMSACMCVYVCLYACVYVCLSVWICVLVCVDMCACLCVYACATVCFSRIVFDCVCVCLYVCVDKCVCMRAGMCACLCGYVCLYVCVYVCLYVCIYVWPTVCLFVCVYVWRHPPHGRALMSHRPPPTAAIVVNPLCLYILLLRILLCSFLYLSPHWHCSMLQSQCCSFIHWRR